MASLLMPCGIRRFGRPTWRRRHSRPGAAPHAVMEAALSHVVRNKVEAAVLVEQWRREYNTVRPHSACGGFPPAPEAIKPSPWFLRMPVLHGPPQVLGLT